MQRNTVLIIDIATSNTAELNPSLEAFMIDLATRNTAELNPSLKAFIIDLATSNMGEFISQDLFKKSNHLCHTWRVDRVRGMRH